MTDVIVTSNQGSILAQQYITSNVYGKDTELLVVLDPKQSIITLTNSDTILVESNTVSTLVTGLLGPQGPAGPSEEDNMYSKRIDFVTDTQIYKAEASVGSAESAAVWRIRFIQIYGDGDVTETWASGNSNFDKAWTDRATLTYT